MTSEYRAGLFAQPAFGVFATSMWSLFLIAFLLVGAWTLAVLAFFTGVVAVIRLRYRRIIFYSDAIHYDGWFYGVTISHSDIRRVRTAWSFGYPTDRFHAGQHCIVTPRRRYWVGLNWYSPSAHRHFADRYLKKHAVGYFRRGKEDRLLFES